MEATLVLATLAQRWRLRLAPNQTIELQPKITLRPRYGIRMVPELRTPAAWNETRHAAPAAAPCYS